MNLSTLFSKNNQAELDAPPQPMLPIYRAIFVVFLLSFVFDYKAVNLTFGDAGTGGSKIQYLFLLIALMSGGLGSLLGFRHLFTKPGVFLVVIWWGYTFYAIGVALASGNEIGRMLRLLIPSLLVGFGINLTLICACAGMRPREAVRWFLAFGLTNVVWKFIYGGFLSGVPLNEVRMGILSPAMRFLFAWAGCAMLLRYKFTPWILVVFGLPLLTAVISITRSMAFPIAISFMAAAFCLALAMVWRMYDLKHAVRKFSLVSSFGVASLLIVTFAMIALPDVRQRWHQRLFDNKGQGGATTQDLSTLMRKAEAKSMWDLLSENPHTFIYGKGLGSPYYWDEDYYTELFLVYRPDRHQFPLEIYSAGHSIWTYTLFSRGWIGIFITLLVFGMAMAFSLRSAYLNSKTVMGPRARDTYLMFLPFVAMWAMISESITRNPFDERFTGVMFGFMLAFSQFYFNRAYYLKHREKVGQGSTQIIMDEESAESMSEGSSEDKRTHYPGQHLQPNLN